jgi:hypothetical protein
MLGGDRVGGAQQEGEVHQEDREGVAHQDRLGKPAPPAAGETSAAVADKAERVCRPGKPAQPAAGETSAAAADKAERLC